jgi:hypothetical protein
MGRNRKPDLKYSNYRPDRPLSNANNSVINQQVLTEQMYKRHLTELCVNRFKWENVPEEFDGEVLRFLEINTFYNAVTLFYQHPVNKKYMLARAAGTGPINAYDNPTQWTTLGMGVGFESYTLDDDECVPIYCNALRTPDTDVVNLFSMKLANLDRTIELNVKNLRYTKVLTVDESQRLTWSNIMRKIEQGDPFVLGTTQLDIGAVQALDVGAHPETLPKLLEAKSKLWNECMGLLGLNNANQDKKERLVTDEVSANDEQVQASRNLHLKARKSAADKINKMFNLNINVRFDGMVDTTVPGTASDVAAIASATPIKAVS